MNSFLIFTALLAVSADFTHAEVFTDPVFDRRLDQSVLLVQAPVAETLTGRVVTSTGATGLGGVTVSLLDAEDAILDVTTTDAEGRFQLDLDVMDEITPRAVFNLSLLLEAKNGAKMKVRVADVAGRYASTIKLRDINFR